MIRSKLLILTIILFISGCASKPATSNKESLIQYAEANCMFWYFKSNGIDTTDIRSIAGGIVEKSNYSVDVFEELSNYVKDYNPKLKSKNNINLQLNKCYTLRQDKNFLEKLKSY